MKTKIEIITPDEFELYEDEEDNKVSKEEMIEFAVNWHTDLVSVITNIKKIINESELMEIEEYWNEDGELPTFKIVQTITPNTNTKEQEQ
jgi:hypothetical protein